MSAIDGFREVVRSILPSGAFWRGEPAERLLDALTALEPAVEMLATLDRAVMPFTAERPILEAWYEYLAQVTCVPIPADLEELRARVLELYAAVSAAFPSGLEAIILSYLPFVEIDELLPLSVMGYNFGGDPAPLELPAPADPWASIVEVWYPPALVPPEYVECVARPYIPGVAEIRPVTPAVLFYQPTASKLAGDISAQWDEMRLSTDAVFRRRSTLGGPTIETATLLAIEPRDIWLLSDVFPLLSAVSSLAGQTVSVTFTRTWGGKTADILTAQQAF